MLSADELRFDASETSLAMAGGSLATAASRGSFVDMVSAPSVGRSTEDTLTR